MPKEEIEAIIYHYLMEHVHLTDKSQVDNRTKPVFTLEEVNQFTKELNELISPKPKGGE